MNRITTLLALLCCCAAGTTRADSLYSVGNSLTLDCCGNNAIAAFDAALGNSLLQGSHIRLGSALDIMVARPDDSFSGPPAWNVALPAQSWNFLALEPYPSATSTLATDLDAVATLVAAARTADPARPPLVLLFAAWPDANAAQAAGGFSEYWNQPVSTQSSQPTTLSRRYFDILLALLTERYGSTVRFRIIPAGDLMAAVDAAVRGGELGELSSVLDLYRDGLHLGDAGRYLSGLATIMSLRGARADGLPIPSTYMQDFNGARITTTLAASFARIANGAIPPAVVDAPTGLSATIGTNGSSLQLSWNMPAYARSWILYTSGPDGQPDPHPARFEWNAPPQAGVSSLVPGRTYRFAVRVLSSTDISEPSAVLAVTMPPTIPSGLQAEPAISGVMLNWRGSEGAQSYSVYSSPNADLSAATLLASDIVTTSYAAQGVAGAGRYYYVVARAGAAQSSPSQAVYAQGLVPPAEEPETRGGGEAGAGFLLLLLLVLAGKLRRSRTLTASG